MNITAGLTVINAHACVDALLTKLRTFQRLDHKDKDKGHDFTYKDKDKDKDN